MDKYLGTKLVKAQPMTRGVYNTYRGWDIPANEDPTDDGYLVEYLDGGTPNHKDHEGYISWSPKDVFERSYKPAETPKDRVVIEITELEEKIKKLQEFIDTPSFFRVLDDRAQRLLVEQVPIMKEYRDHLSIRLELM